MCIGIVVVVRRYCHWRFCRGDHMPDRPAADPDLVGDLRRREPLPVHVHDRPIAKRPLDKAAARRLQDLAAEIITEPPCIAPA